MTRQRYVLLVDINPALSILGQPPAATLGEAYSFMFQYFGGTAPYTCTVVGSVPSGWTFNAGTGVLSHPGPSTPGTLSLTLKLRDADYRETAPTTYTWSVVALPLQIAGDAPGGTIGTAYTTTYTATGGVAPRTFAVVSGTLPPGLSLDGSTGVLAGTPTTAGAYSWTVRVTDSASATADLADSATIAYPTLALSGSYAGGAVASAYSSDLTISGGDGSYSNARVTSGSLPAGLSLSIVGSALRLSGTPTAEGSSTFTVAVDSGDGQTVSSSQTVAITITEARYWRLYIPSTEASGTASGYINCCLIGLQYLPGQTTNQAAVVGGTCSESSALSAGYNSSYAWLNTHYDGTYLSASFWHSGAQSAPWWASIDAGSGKTIKATELALIGTNIASRMPNEFMLQTSSDGSTWTTVSHYSGISGWTDGVVRRFAIPHLP